MKDKNRKFSLWILAWPIFIELFLQLMLGAADTLMVSKISDDAVAVVGFANQIFYAMTLLIITVAGGAGILIAQKIGAKKEQDARTIAVMTVNVSVIIGIILSVFLYTQPRAIVQWLQMPESLLPIAQIYISIVGAGMVFTSLMLALSTVIRNTGNTKGPMYTAIAMNVVHVFLNYAFIYGAFGFPEWGITGVAISTIVSRLLATIMLFVMYINSFECKISIRDIRLFNMKLFKAVIRIGWPLGVSNSAWMLAQLVLFSFIAVIGAEELATRTYLNTLESFCFMLGYSIALAVQIQIAHLYGAGQTQGAYSSAYRALWISLALVIINAMLILLFGKYLLGLFSTNSNIIILGVSMLGLNLILQPGKVLNMVVQGALNAVGDTRFTMIVSVCSQLFITVALSYWLGIYLGWGLLGIYVAMITDEYVRGFLALYRWRGRKYLYRVERAERRKLEAHKYA
jgi:putative MATE family efflux protein